MNESLQGAASRRNKAGRLPFKSSPEQEEPSLGGQPPGLRGLDPNPNPQRPEKGLPRRRAQAGRSESTKRELQGKASTELLGKSGEEEGSEQSGMIPGLLRGKGKVGGGKEGRASEGEREGCARRKERKGQCGLQDR